VQRQRLAPAQAADAAQQRGQVEGRALETVQQRRQRRGVQRLDLRPPRLRLPLDVSGWVDGDRLEPYRRPERPAQQVVALADGRRGERPAIGPALAAQIEVERLKALGR